MLPWVSRAVTISGLTSLTTPDAADLLEVVDVSDTSESGNGTNKKTTPLGFANYLGFSSGLLTFEAGGLEADVSTFGDSLLGILSGVTTEINTEAELETAIGTTLATEADIANQVTASSVFSAADYVLTSAGAARQAQASVVSINGSGDISGVGVLSTSSLIYSEKAAQGTPAAGKGEYWVINETPNKPIFTDDAGTDFDLAIQKDTWIIACSDETTDLETGNGKITFLAPYAATITSIEASVTTAPTGANLIVDVNEAGTSMMTTNKCVIEATETSTLTATTAPTETDTSVAQWAVITVDIDQIGSTVAGAGLKVYISHTHY